MREQRGNNLPQVTQLVHRSLNSSTFLSPASTHLTTGLAWREVTYPVRRFSEQVRNTSCTNRWGAGDSLSEKEEDLFWLLIRRCFNIYLAFCFHWASVKPASRDICVIGKRICDSQFPRGGGMVCLAGPPRVHQGWPRGRRSKVKVWAKTFIVFFSTEKNRRVSVSSWPRLGLDALSNLGELWAIEAVCSCPFPGPGRRIMSWLAGAW